MNRQDVDAIRVYSEEITDGIYECLNVNYEKCYVRVVVKNNNYYISKLDDYLEYTYEEERKALDYIGLFETKKTNMYYTTDSGYIRKVKFTHKGGLKSRIEWVEDNLIEGYGVWITGVYMEYNIPFKLDYDAIITMLVKKIHTSSEIDIRNTDW